MSEQLWSLESRYNVILFEPHKVPLMVYLGLDWADRSLGQGYCLHTDGLTKELSSYGGRVFICFIHFHVPRD